MSEKKIDDYTLTISNGTTVTGCNVHAYGNNVTVNLAEGITNIAPYAFENCTGIRVIKLPKSIVEIGQCAFMNCTDLEEVRIPDTVRKIGNGIFRNCSKLKRTHIPVHVRENWKSFIRGLPSFMW